MSDEELDAELEVFALEFGGERGHLAHAGDASPGCLVDGDVMGAAVEVHGGDDAVGLNGEADERLPFLVERRVTLFRNEGVPGGGDEAFEALEVGAEVDALGVGEDFHAGVGSLVGVGCVGPVFAALAMAARGGIGGLADSVASVGGGGEVWSSGCRRLRRVRDGRRWRGGWLRANLRLLLRLGRRGLRSGGGLGFWSRGEGLRCGGAGFAGSAHGLQLRESLFVERGVRGLGAGAVIADRLGVLGWN